MYVGLVVECWGGDGMVSDEKVKERKIVGILTFYLKPCSHSQSSPPQLVEEAKTHSQPNVRP